MATSSDFEAIFARLRSILAPHSVRLSVKADAPDHYCLEIPLSPKVNKGFPVGWVKIGRGYVSYHFMPVYMFPELRASISQKLRARMQGKSCFNFKVVDEDLFKELEQVTEKGFAIAKDAGYEP
ncbi:MAG: hypothetical protein EHM18_09660 [Acidobacteria bacterium]|nr:MAG: hypothetical protein EHM18_09660 [Acidobacteriota bacterium]